MLYKIILRNDTLDYVENTIYKSIANSLISCFFGLLIPYYPLPGYFDFSFPFFSISVGFQVFSSQLDSRGNVLSVHLRILPSAPTGLSPKKAKLVVVEKFVLLIYIYIFFKGMIVQF